MEKTLLIVDDEEDILDSLCRLFRKENFKIITAKSGKDGLKLLDTNRVDIVLSDQRMPVMTGSEFLAQVKDKYPDTIRMVLSGYSDIEAILAAINQGNIYKFITKPWDTTNLKSVIYEAFEQREILWQSIQLHEVFMNTIEGIMFFNHDGKIIDVNPAFSNLTKIAKDDAIQRDISIFKHKGGMDILDILPEVNNASFWRGEMYFTLEDETRPIWMTITRIYDKDKRIDHYAGLFMDITEQKKSEARLQYQAYHDPLTGLGNKNYFIEQLDFLVKHHKTDQKIAVFFIGVDRFKKINDGFGHDFGDHVLIKIAHMLETVIPKHSIIAHFTGDEFAVIYHLDHQSEITTQIDGFSQTVLDSFADNIEIDHQDLHIEISMGVAIYPDNGEAPKDLLRNANTALYKAKMYGGHNLQYYSLDMNAHAKKSLFLESDLIKAIENQELNIVLQPKRCVNSKKIVSAEVLLRWNHPSHGFISPGFFIPIAEQSNYILMMGNWVFEQACQAIQAIDNIDHVAPMPLAVNISPRQLASPKLLDDLQAAFNNFNVQPSRIECEITESVIIDNKDNALTILNSIKELGCSLAMDDFGTGYSSLSYLKDLPFDTLKIDQSFIRYLNNEPQNQAIVSAIISMAQNLNLKVVAEGVEDEEQWNFLHELQCDYIQGFLGGQPMLLDDFIELLKSS